MIKIKYLPFFFFTLITTLLHAEAIGGNQLTTQEAELAKLINDYRQQNGKTRLAVSKSLTYVARWHVWDASHNNAISGSCNLHSWSNAKPAIWDAMCYTGDHAQAQQMWSKPSQITNGIFTGYGYENSAWSYPSISAPQAFNMWKNSKGHRILMLEEEMFSSINLQSMGVGISEGYAYVWFAHEKDPQGNFSTSPSPQPTPTISNLFFDGFDH